MSMKEHERQTDHIQTATRKDWKIAALTNQKVKEVDPMRSTLTANGKARNLVVTGLRGGAGDRD